MAIKPFDHRMYSLERPSALEQFASKFDARIEDSKEYRQYVRQMPHYMWDGKLPMDVETQVVPMKAIHLSTDSLNRLLREQEEMDRIMDDAEYGRKVLSNLRADERVRDQNPVVQKAYMKYLTLLELCRK